MQFEPYAKAIGFLLREWNDLQERFATLFTTVVNNENPIPARAAWYSIQSDRSQRKMLRDATIAAFSVNPEIVEHAELRQNHRIRRAVCWAVEKADLLGTHRDEAAHSPVAIYVGDPIEFIAREFMGHPIALRLKGKKLLTEFEFNRTRAQILRAYVSALNQHLREPTDVPFPQKPAWPDRPAETTKATPPRKAPAE